MSSDSQNRLDVINLMIKEYLESGKDMLLSSKLFLENIQKVTKKENPIFPSSTKKIDHIIISCDASVKTNPGGPGSIGVVVQYPERDKQSYAQIIPNATTNNLAEYFAIYFGLLNFINLHNVPKFYIEVRSDSQLCINQLLRKTAGSNLKLLNKRDCILDLVKQIPVKVEFVWRPRCSTPELKEANDLAQEILGVKIH